MTTAFVQRLISWTLLTLTISLGPPQETEAALITYDFEGTITALSGPAFNLPGPISIGQTLTGSFSYESSTGPGRDIDPTRGDYFGAITNLSIATGSYTGSGLFPSVPSGSPGVVITVVNNDVNGDQVSVSAFTAFPPIDGNTVSGVSLNFQDPSGLTLESRALETLPSLSGFPSKSFTISLLNVPASSFVVGEITSVTPVPLPAAAVLFPTGLGLLAVVLRRREGGLLGRVTSSSATPAAGPEMDHSRILS